MRLRLRQICDKNFRQQEYDLRDNFFFFLFFAPLPLVSSIVVVVVSVRAAIGGGFELGSGGDGDGKSEMPPPDCGLWNVLMTAYSQIPRGFLSPPALILFGPTSLDLCQALAKRFW
ncbi:hypothetical protein PIB30_057062 [Stylosanthes scabra]|uniref:Uncharacterized protein n=1 Tax=Stylosanthes scabra TaxID=79078 RepID=A0ABU6ZI88_9FABA|nr:hypothetical protein [Stylosanthes scabra]